MEVLGGTEGVRGKDERRGGGFRWNRKYEGRG